MTSDAFSTSDRNLTTHNGELESDRTIRAPSDVAVRKPRLLYMVTDSIAVRSLLAGQLAYMREQGFDVTVIASPGHLDVAEERERVRAVPIVMDREISPFRDLVSLWHIYRAIRRLRPDILNASTAKAGLLGMIAGAAARVPIRIYLLRGLRLETTRGVKRFVLTLTERIAATCAHRVICISESVRCACVARRIAPREKTSVLLEGSSNGIDVDRFLLTDQARSAASELRRSLKIPSDAPLIGFVGRLTRDKGIVDLTDAFDRVSDRLADARLLIVGNFESGDPVPEEYVRRLRDDPRIVMVGFVSDTSAYYPLMDVLAFPSYREGFGNVAIEAASAEVPVVGFDVTGVRDSVSDGVTGTLVPPGDTAALADALLKYLSDEQLRRRHGLAGCERAKRSFRREPMWQAWLEEYRRLLAARGLPSPEKPQG